MSILSKNYAMTYLVQDQQFLYQLTLPSVIMFKVWGLFIFLSIVIDQSNAESVQAVMVKTSDCWQCGMIEDLGQLDIKVCGDVSCCFIQHLDNDQVNFQAGTIDRFEGASGLLECFNFQVKNNERKHDTINVLKLYVQIGSGSGRMAISLFHEGSDGIKVDSVSIETEGRTTRCPIGIKLDNGEWYSSNCI